MRPISAFSDQSIVVKNIITVYKSYTLLKTFLLFDIDI